jgi:predicted glycoside hydrolase/deacetylase ChbG (UPF0249 family)
MINENKRENIILTADDFGKSEKANRNILKLARAGKLDRVSVMADGDMGADEVKELLSLNVKIDIHFELIWQKRRRNMLRDKALRQVAVFFVNYVWGDWPVPENPRSGKESVEREWKGQIEKFKRMFGRVPDGISSHEHSHFFPPYFAIAVDLAMHFEIPFIRLGEKGFLGELNVKKLILDAMRRCNMRRFLKSGLDSTDYFASLDWVESMEKFSENSRDKEVEMACHPERDEELEFIISRWV